MLTKTQLEAWVVSMRQNGMSAPGANCYIRALNSFLSWAHAEGHVDERLRLKQLPDPKKPLRPFSDAEVRLLLQFKPKGRLQVRTWTLILCLLDTGLRIDEVLGLQRSNVDLDALTMKVRGKGSKERAVPFSLELRKALYRVTSSHTGRYVFRTASGLRVTYRNAYRDIKALAKCAGVEGDHVHPHAFRHCFAVTYIRNGGDLYRLSRLLGHTSMSTTQIYLRSMGVEHLGENHSLFSPLSRLR